MAPAIDWKDRPSAALGGKGTGIQTWADEGERRVEEVEAGALEQAEED